MKVACAAARAFTRLKRQSFCAATQAATSAATLLAAALSGAPTVVDSILLPTGVLAVKR